MTYKTKKYLINYGFSFLFYSSIVLAFTFTMLLVFGVYKLVNYIF